jgi:ketosteroid isomerase-like protein
MEALAMALATFDRQEVGWFGQAFEELFYRDDAAAMTSFHTQDAVIMAPDSEVVRGWTAIEEFWVAASQTVVDSANRPAPLPAPPSRPGP